MVSLFTHEFTKAQKVTIPEALEGQRLDNFLFTHLKGVPKTRIYRIIRKGEVRVNSGRIKPMHRLKTGDLLRIPPIRVEPKEDALWLSRDQQTANALLKQILYEDDELLVINKPPGMAVHGGSGVSFGVIEALRHLREDAYLELVHRLDKGTSGCLLIAKRRSMLRKIHALFRTNEVEKTYLALVKGVWQGDLEVRAPLQKGQLESGERFVRVSKDGQEALTEFSVLKCYSDISLMQAKPKTGRTHQIRVHSAFVGNPIVGDIKYGDGSSDCMLGEKGRLFLHASRIAFPLPGREGPLVVEAPLDKTWEHTLSQLSGKKTL